MARNNTPVDKNSREYLLRQVANGRYSLLLIVILTVVNLIMTILDTNTYFLFSASVPYYLVFVGMGIENGFVDGAWNVKGTLTYITSAEVYTASSNPTEFLREQTGDAIQRMFIEGTLWQLGISNGTWENIGSMDVSTEEERAAFLRRLAGKDE